MTDRSRRVLLLDDDVLLAIDLGEQLTAVGYEVLGPAATVPAACALLERGCDCAIIDVQLATETSEQVARLLRDAGTPFIVLTGYTDVGPAFAGGHLLKKPLCFDDLITALSAALDAEH